MVAGVLLFVPQVAKACGYRLVLNGSAFSFKANTDPATLSEQLNKLEEDFNLVVDKNISKANILCFTKSYQGQKTVLQFFLKPKENGTDVVLVAHSIEKDVPMRTGREELMRIGKSIVKWLQVSGDFPISETDNESLVAQVVAQSKKSFYRRPAALPSKVVIRKFLTDHWKDIALIVSVVVALLSWLFPLKL